MEEYYSLSEFATHMGIYIEDELPGRIGNRMPMSDVGQAQLWHTLIGISLYNASTYKASNIHDPRIRILHRIIAITFYGQLESIGNVTHGDLDFINSILNSQFLCPDRVLAVELSKMAGKLPNQAIAGGAFITRLAHGLGMATEDLTLFGQNLGFSLQMLKNIKVVGEDRHRHFLLTKNGQEWTEPRAGDRQEPGLGEFQFPETSAEFYNLFDMPPAGSQVGPSQPPPTPYYHSLPHVD